MKIVRTIRTVIVFICVLLLIPGLALRYPSGRYYAPELKEMVLSGDAKVIDYKVRGKLDEDTFIVERLIYTEDTLYIRYSTILSTSFFGFPAEALALFDNKGKEYPKFGNLGGSSFGLRGTEGLISFERPQGGIEYLLLVYNFYDRRMEIKLPLGEVDHNE